MLKLSLPKSGNTAIKSKPFTLPFYNHLGVILSRKTKRFLRNADITQP